MISFNPNPLCRQAEPYYCDFLFSESRDIVPGFIVDHIKQCPHCQEQLNQLENELSKANILLQSEPGQVAGAITLILRPHFAYVGKPVTCQAVKPFLPGLLDPALEIRMPTPITVHLDHCKQCTQDLETIRGLNLSRKQLYRLSQLFVAEPAEDSVSCSQANAAIMAFVSIAFSETTEQVLKHLCTCYYCRKVLYQYRETILTEYLREKGEQKNPLCNQIPVTDIFDYVVPYGLDPAHDPYNKFRTSLTSHLRSCPVCLAKMQGLHNTVYGIIERPESEIVTIYHLDESARTASEPDNLYSGFPINVEVLSSQNEVESPQLAPTFSLADVSKEKASVLKGKRLVKTGVAAAAAALIVAALLLFNMPIAQAVTINQIYKAIEKVQNVYIASYIPHKKEPVQELWISKIFNIYVTKAKKQLVLWDIPNAVRKTKYIDTDVTDISKLSDDMVANIERTINSFLGLVPFHDISEIPDDAKWSRVDKEDLRTASQNAEIYDLTWVRTRFDGSPKFWKWRVFANIDTHLPIRVEWYEKLTIDDEFALATIMEVEYLNDDEIQAAIQDASF
jgi:hypothetical protein